MTWAVKVAVPVLAGVPERTPAEDRLKFNVPRVLAVVVHV